MCMYVHFRSCQRLLPPSLTSPHLIEWCPYEHKDQINSIHTSILESNQIVQSFADFFGIPAVGVIYVHIHICDEDELACAQALYVGMISWASECKQLSWSDFVGMSPEGRDWTVCLWYVHSPATQHQHVLFSSKKAAIGFLFPWWLYILNCLYIGRKVWIFAPSLVSVSGITPRIGFLPTATAYINSQQITDRGGRM